jgi:dTDP-D-glucose 4,6-dehydratase
VYNTADKDSFASIDKLKKALNWHPKYSNAQALIKSYDWYQEHYREIKSRGSGVSHTVGWKQGILGIVKKIM